LDLSAYRELEAFAQFGSDLDAATQARLNRGARTLEVLKQGLHEAVPVAKEVIILYALAHRHLDKLELEDVLRYQNELFEFMDNSYQSLEDTITETGNLPEGDTLNDAINEFDKTFQPTKHGDAAADNGSAN